MLSSYLNDFVVWGEPEMDGCSWQILVVSASGGVREIPVDIICWEFADKVRVVSLGFASQFMPIIRPSCRPVHFFAEEQFLNYPCMSE